MQHIAKEGRCFVISVNSVCKVADFPADYPPFTSAHHDRKPDGSKWETDDIVNHGGSCIVGPLGTFITEPLWDKEDIIFADLKMSDIREARVSQPRSPYQSSPPATRSLTQGLHPGYSSTSIPLEATPDQMYCKHDISSMFTSQIL